jgi:hypothetical protein
LVFLVNDTLVKVNAGIAYPAAQGGTATYCAGIINYLSGKNMKFGLIGNFDSYEKEMVLKKINASSNFKFLFNLFCLFSQRRFLRHGILYFQRPDHLAFSVLSSARKVLHLHGQSYSNIQ